LSLTNLGDKTVKIIVIGGSGTIGDAVVKELSPQHQVIVVGLQHGDIQVDITDKNSIEKMYKTVGEFDGVIATTGKVHFGVLDEMTAEHYDIGLKNKLMGQINLVLLGMQYINDGGSFTLTSGILNHDPVRLASSAAMVNGALDGFVKSAAIEMSRGMRINVVSPTIIRESVEKYASYFPGFAPVDVATVALAYRKSVEGAQTGQVYRVGYTA
jgi:NAD(P)-dependent dehydrogenase (short-subunit alcohol dehydrogenase family)